MASARIFEKKKNKSIGTVLVHHDWTIRGKYLFIATPFFVFFVPSPSPFPFPFPFSLQISTSFSFISSNFHPALHITIQYNAIHHQLIPFRVFIYFYFFCGFYFSSFPPVSSFFLLIFKIFVFVHESWLKLAFWMELKYVVCIQQMNKSQKLPIHCMRVHVPRYLLIIVRSFVRCVRSLVAAFLVSFLSK